MDNIKYIIFDLSEVLISGLLGVEKVLCTRLNLTEDYIVRCLCGEHFDKYMMGQMDEDKYLQEIIRRQNWTIEPGEFKEIIRKNFHTEVDGTLHILQRLSEKYRLILLSDHSKEWIEYITGVHSFFSHFERVFYSYELGMTKKNPEIFRHLLETMSLKGEECFFIDDHERNIKNALLSGIRGVTFTDSVKLEEDLIKAGILQPMDIPDKQ